MANLAAPPPQRMAILATMATLAMRTPVRNARAAAHRGWIGAPRGPLFIGRPFTCRGGTPVAMTLWQPGSQADAGKLPLARREIVLPKGAVYNVRQEKY